MLLYLYFTNMVKTMVDGWLGWSNYRCRIAETATFNGMAAIEYKRERCLMGVTIGISGRSVPLKNQ